MLRIGSNIDFAPADSRYWKHGSEEHSNPVGFRSAARSVEHRQKRGKRYDRKDYELRGHEILPARSINSSAIARPTGRPSVTSSHPHCPAGLVSRKTNRP